jgi:hypothetical protein
MDDRPSVITGAWAARNAVADALITSEQHVRSLVQGASVEELVEFIDAFSPTRSPGPDWTRSFEPLVERLWQWCDPETLAQLEATYRARGLPWMAVANDFTEKRGAELKARVRRPAWARYPVFSIT